jgi:AmmeMemoRadiSam system protein B
MEESIMVRESVVSGLFYPNDPDELKKLIEKCKQKEPSQISARAVVLPHAGYIYSGRVAVTTVGKVLPKKRIIILGPNHTGYGEAFSLWPKGAWKLPFGQVEIDQELARLILDSGEYVKEDQLAHQKEHSIEVELPILQYFFGEFKFVPIVCASDSIDVYQGVASQIYEGVKKLGEEVFFVASSDMTHYEPDAAARKKDRIAIENIINLDEENLVKEVIEKDISMCGIAPVSILLSCIKKLGARKAQVALYQTSGDATGDNSSVVGYAGVVIK